MFDFYRGKLRAFILLLIIFFLLFLISFSPLKSNGFLMPARKVFVRIIYPFQYIFKAATFGVLESFSGWFFLKDKSIENDQLKQEIQKMQARLQAFDYLQKENNRLANALQFKQKSSFSLVPARVVSRSPETFFRFVQIDKGSRFGILENFPVITPKGLLGKIVLVTLDSSLVLMVVYPESAVSAVDGRTNTFGVAEGLGVDKLHLKYVPVREKIEEGDIISTSGLSDFFPPGIPIGKVLKIQRQPHDIFCQIEIEPSIDFSRLDKVFVILKK